MILSHEPERHFLFRLIEQSRLFTSWVKSPDKNFYTLDYEYWKAGKDRVRRSFNPGFFIRIRIGDYILHLDEDEHAIPLKRLRNLQDWGVEDLILVVEIKSDDDESESTRAKTRYADDHFKALNLGLKETNPIDLSEPFRDSIKQQYLFYILRPADYPTCFHKLKHGEITFDLAD